MRRMFGAGFIAIAVASSMAGAQADTKTAQPGAPTAMMALKWSDLVGDWVGSALRATNDSVVTEITVSFAADQKSSVKFPNRDAYPARVITMGGDSVVTEAGPYPSVTRAGHQVSTRVAMHVRNHMAWGTFHAAFDDNTALDGRVKLNHHMQ